MMASVDEGIGAILEVLERQGKLDDTFIVFLGDNGYFFGEHALGPSGASRTKRASDRPSSSATRARSRRARDGASS